MPDADATTRQIPIRENVGAVSATKRDDSDSIGGVIQLVKDYARQETLGPLRGAGRWLAFGVVGAVLLGLATVLLVLGVLRLLQNEFAPTFRGQWMHVLPYVAAAAVGLAVIGIAVSRIGKNSLQKENS